jgi:hypothetical protein
MSSPKRPSGDETPDRPKDTVLVGLYHRHQMDGAIFSRGARLPVDVTKFLVLVPLISSRGFLCHQISLNRVSEQ